MTLFGRTTVWDGIFEKRACNGRVVSTYPSLDMPGDNRLCRRDIEFLRNRLYFRDLQCLPNLLAAAERRVCFKKQAVFPAPPQQLRLRVPVAELNLVYSGLVSEWVVRQILDSGDVETMPNDELLLKHVIGVDPLANANVSYFTLVDHLL